MNAYLVGAACLCAAIVTNGNVAQAALIACPGTFTADGTARVNDGTLALNSAASLCQYDTATDQSTVETVANINASAFFGFSDWIDNGQTQMPGGVLNGTWTLNAPDFAHFDYLMVFKDGAGTHLTAFLLNEEFTSGAWSTPFTDPPFDLPGETSAKRISGYTIVKRDPPVAVPAPPAWILLLTGLAGYGLLRGRRRSAKPSA